MKPLLLVCISIGFGVAQLCAEVRVKGQVITDTNAPVANASITLRRELPSAATYRGVTDPTGAFAIPVDEPGEYLIDVERTGYFALRDRPLTITSAESDLKMVLNPIREMSE